MRFAWAWLIAALLAATSAGAEMVLYATSIRVHYTDSATEVECSLYRVDPATGAATLLAPIHAGANAVAVITLAVHPRTGVVYGITAGLSPAIPKSLVTIDPLGGDATVIGPLALGISDVAFTREGELLAWLPERDRLARVNLGTAALDVLDASGIEGIMGGGLAIDDHDNAYVAATSANGTLDSVNVHTGRGTHGPQINGAPYISAITNLTFAPDGRLYGVNSNMGSPANTALVTIDPVSGAVKEVGKLPNDAHALIFVPKSASPANEWPLYAWWGLLISVILAAVVFGVRWVRRH